MGVEESDLPQGLEEVIDEDPTVKLVLQDARKEVSEAARVSFYKGQYEALDDKFRSRYSWAEVERRLLANNAHYLQLAEGLNENGILFGVDSTGNLLFADGGKEPIMKGKNYMETREAVLFKQVEGSRVKTGYEMFPHNANKNPRPPVWKSSEILMFEKATKGPFVKSDNDKSRVYSWLESGEEDRGQAAIIKFEYDNWDPKSNARDDQQGNFHTHVIHGPSKAKSSNYGVRRLLRVPG